MQVLWSLLVVCVAFQTATAAEKVVCYIMGARDDIDPHLCTHINYAFVGVGVDGALNQPSATALKTLAGLKTKNANLKLLISVGGGSASPAVFSAIAASAPRRANLVKTAREILLEYKFDGVDLDWEIPAVKDKENFVTLLEELKTDFKKNGWLVTAAVTAIASGGYDIPKLAEVLDIFNVMTYDLYGPWSHYTGQNSALYPSKIESVYEKDNLNVEASINQWIKAGAPAAKLCAGIAFYGHSFTLANPANHGLHAAVKGAGRNGGSITYSAFCRDKTWECTWDDEQKMPICVSGDQWLGIDNVRSIEAKIAFIKSKKLGGAMIWALNHDDIAGACGKAWPLLNAVNTI